MQDIQNIATYRNHYSSTLNKCFYVEFVSSVPVGSSKNRPPSYHMGLLDLIENNEWGRFFQQGKNAPAFCHVREKSCHSQEEWLALIKPYMDD